MRQITFAALVAAAVTGPAVATETISYTYDEQGRVALVSHSGTVNNGQTASYGYDKADNRTTLSVTGAPH